jgi:hypothetical protein
MRAEPDHAALLDLGERARMGGEGNAAQSECRKHALHRKITPQSGFRSRI